MAYSGIGSSLGFAIVKDVDSIPSGTIAYLETTQADFVLGTDNFKGSITVNNTTYNCYTTRVASSGNVISIYDGTTWLRTTPATPGIFGFVCQKSSSTVEFGILTNESVSDVATWYANLQRLVAGHPTGVSYYYSILYTGTDSDLQEMREWDESPEQDGDNTEDVVGGENADTDPFDFTQMQSTWPDPDADFISPYATDGQGNPIPGLYTPYELTPAQLQALGAVLYDSDMFDTLVQKLNGSSNPISGILRCIQIPVVTNLGSGSYNICVFGEKLHSENHSDPTGAHLRGRWVTKNGGSVTLKEVWGTYRDYTDTQVSIFLPFVGVRQLDPQLCVGKTLELRCYIDAYTGDVLWLLRSSNTGIGGKFYESGGFIGRWSGNCATEIPIGRIDNTRALATLIGGLSGIVMAPFTGGASLGATGASLAGMLTGGAQSMGVVSGNITGHLGTADILYPYLIVQRSVPDYPNGWRGRIGAVKNQSYSCDDLSGFTLFSQIFLENMEGASGEEIDALRNELCSEGIIF